MRKNKLVLWILLIALVLGLVIIGVSLFNNKENVSMSPGISAGSWTTFWNNFASRVTPPTLKSNGAICNNNDKECSSGVCENGKCREKVPCNPPKNNNNQFCLDSKYGGKCESYICKTECTTDSWCYDTYGNKNLCNLDKGRCVECITDSDCGSGKCNAKGLCEYETPEIDLTCTADIGQCRDSSCLNNEEMDNSKTCDNEEICCIKKTPDTPENPTTSIPCNHETQEGCDKNGAYPYCNRKNICVKTPTDCNEEDHNCGDIGPKGLLCTNGLGHCPKNEICSNEGICKNDCTKVGCQTGWACNTITKNCEEKPKGDESRCILMKGTCENINWFVCKDKNEWKNDKCPGSSIWKCCAPIGVCSGSTEDVVCKYNVEITTANNPFPACNKYLDLLKKYWESNGLKSKGIDLILLLSLINQESSCDNNQKNGQGLMQVVSCAKNGRSICTLEQNIDQGTKELAQNFENAKGISSNLPCSIKIQLSLFAYNRGDSAASKAVSYVNKGNDLFYSMVLACKYYYNTYKGCGGFNVNDCCGLTHEGLGAKYPEKILNSYKEACGKIGGTIN
ncbi:MAG: transglycosylase SLT domain-containing protein [Candidatus Pacearchaeota archaeon]|jgi:hypothetical protein